MAPNPAEVIQTNRVRAVTRLVLGLIAVVLTLAALVHPISVFLARWEWRADLLSHFPGPALVVTLAALAVVAIVKRLRIVALPLALLAVWQAGILLQHDGPNPVSPARQDAPRLRILLANVLFLNPNRQALADLIRTERPDVVGLVEVEWSWLADLDRLGIRSLYPYRLELPIGSQGLALWFRDEPLSMDGPRLARPDGNPYFTASFDFAGQTRRLWLTHPPNPLFEPERSTPDLRTLGERIGEVGGSRIVLGDLNRGDGSPQFNAFLRATGLRDSRHGYGIQGTFPSTLALRIAIDHVLVSDDLAVVDRRLGPDIGSDHLPLIVDLAPAAGSSPATNAEAQDSQRGSTASTPAFEANFTRSADRKKLASSSARSGPSLASTWGSPAISSVVRVPQSTAATRLANASRTRPDHATRASPPSRPPRSARRSAAAAPHEPRLPR